MVDFCNDLDVELAQVGRGLCLSKESGKLAKIPGAKFDRNVGQFQQRRQVACAIAGQDDSRRAGRYLQSWCNPLGRQQSGDRDGQHLNRKLEPTGGSDLNDNAVERRCGQPTRDEVNFLFTHEFPSRLYRAEFLIFWHFMAPSEFGCLFPTTPVLILSKFSATHHLPDHMCVFSIEKPRATWPFHYGR